jgi:hypothetical protein
MGFLTNMKSVHESGNEAVFYRNEAQSIEQIAQSRLNCDLYDLYDLCDFINFEFINSYIEPQLLSFSQGDKREKDNDNYAPHNSFTRDGVNLFT